MATTTVNGAGAFDFSSLSGDGTATAGGVLTLADPMHIYVAMTNLSTNDIDTLSVTPVTLVAAVASVILVPVVVTLNYTFGTAAFTGGPVNITVRYNTVNTTACGPQNSANSFDGAGNSVGWIAPPVTSAVVNGTLVNRALELVTSGDLVKGTSTGTAVVKTYYMKITP